MKKFQCLHCGKIHEDFLLAAVCCVIISVQTFCRDCKQSIVYQAPGCEGERSEYEVRTDNESPVVFICERCGSYYNDIREAIVCCAMAREVVVSITEAPRAV